MSEKTTIKWAEIAKVKHELRFNFLSDYLNKNGIKNEVHYMDFDSVDFDVEMEKIKNDFDQIRVGSPYGELLGNALSQSTIKAFTLQSCDALIKENGKWWPRSLMEEAFRESIARKFNSLDIESSALIVGVGTTARAVFSSLMSMGYKKFLFAEQFEERAYKALESLRRTFFDIKIDYVEQEKLAYLPGSSSIVVNTTPYVEDNSLLKDLYYFNYITKNAMVVDTNYYPAKPAFIEQAKDLNLNVLDGVSLSARVDMIWAKHCFSANLDFESYLKEWQAYLEQNTNQT